MVMKSHEIENAFSRHGKSSWFLERMVEVMEKS